MNDDWWVAAIVGASLFLAGVVLMRAHIRTWHLQKDDASIGDEERFHSFKQFRRRVQTSAMIALLGILIPVGDSLIPWRKAPTLFAVYWGCVLLLALWIVVQALGDMASTRTHSRVSLGQLQAKQRQLEQELDRLKRRRSNGEKRTE